MYLLVEGKKDAVSKKFVVFSVGQSEKLEANIYKLPNGLRAFFAKCLSFNPFHAGGRHVYDKT